MYFDGGKGANLSLDKYDWPKKISLLFHLLFLAPLKFVMLEIIVAIGTLLKLLIVVFEIIMPFGKTLDKRFDEKLYNTYDFMFKMDKT
jgi:hypothetical protein